MNYSTYHSLKSEGFNPKIVLDIGAYKGDWSRDMRNIFDNLYIISVDANKYSDEIPYSNLSLYEVLLDKDDDEVKFYKTNHSFCVGTGDSVFKENTEYYSTENLIVEVRKTKKLSTILKERNLTNIDMIKIDTQGSELKILQGLGEFITYPEVIQLECSLIDYNLGGCKIHEIINFMYENNFVIFDIIEEHRDNFQNLFQLDILFKKNK